MRRGLLLLLLASAACEPAPDGSAHGVAASAPLASPASSASARSDGALSDRASSDGASSDGAVAAAPAAPAEPAAADRIELTFMGDVMFGGTFSGSWMPAAVPEHDPLAKIAHLYRSDLALANLETTVLSAVPKLKGNLRFVATPDQVATLPRNGLMAVTLANNHANDVGALGVDETPRHLAELGVTVIGAARSGDAFLVDTVDVRGWKVGFVTATTKLNRKQPRERADQQDAPARIRFVEPGELKDALVPVIAEARQHHDLVIAVLHWGEQYEDVPASWQVTAAHAFIDAGASAVVGHHPHVLQGIERYGDGLIAYSLGNFVFQNASGASRSTGVLRLGFSRPTLCMDQAAFHPAVIRLGEIYFPQAARGAELDEVGSRIVKLSASKKLNTSWRLAQDTFVTEPACARPAAAGGELASAPAPSQPPPAPARAQRAQRKPARR